MGIAIRTLNLPRWQKREITEITVLIRIMSVAEKQPERRHLDLAFNVEIANLVGYGLK